ncbi:MAG: hypothetical protein AAF471_06790 [Myxococcota bacterium]
MIGIPASGDDDKLHEECGVFGVFDHREAAALTVLGLHALQHRGQEAAGVVTFDGRLFHSHRAHGLVGDNFSNERVIASLPGRIAIGHNRYATTGGSVLRNIQPLFADFAFGGLALCHNGNLTNALTLRLQMHCQRLAMAWQHGKRTANVLRALNSPASALLRQWNTASARQTLCKCSATR